MSRFLWWAPLMVFILFWAILGFRYGVLALQTSETDVINRFANKYVADAGPGAVLTDCAAYLASNMAGIWLLVSCAPQGAGASYDYYVNRLGGLEFSDGPGRLRAWEHPA